MTKGELIYALKERGILESEIVFRDVSRNNGTKKAGVFITTFKRNAVPIFCLEDLAEMFTWYGDAAAFIIEKTKNACLQIDLTKETILSYCFLEAISARNNKQLLSKVPHEDLLDVAFIVRTTIPDVPNGSVVVSSEMIANLGIANGELFAKAKENIRNDFGCLPVSMFLSSILCGDDLTSEMVNEDNQGLYVVRNRRLMYGASVLAFPEIIGKYVDIIGKDVWIIPTSIHDVMLVEKGDITSVYLKDLVSEINGTQLEPDDVLTDSIYSFSRTTREIKIAQ